jgi:hypothetical protein
LRKTAGRPAGTHAGSVTGLHAVPEQIAAPALHTIATAPSPAATLQPRRSCARVATSITESTLPSGETCASFSETAVPVSAAGESHAA